MLLRRIVKTDYHLFADKKIYTQTHVLVQPHTLGSQHGPYRTQPRAAWRCRWRHWYSCARRLWLGTTTVLGNGKLVKGDVS